MSIKSQNEVSDERTNGQNSKLIGSWQREVEYQINSFLYVFFS